MAIVIYRDNRSQFMQQVRALIENGKVASTHCDISQLLQLQVLCGQFMDKAKTEQHNAKDAEAMATLQVKTCELEDARVILQARAQEVDEARKNENAGHNLITHSKVCCRLTCLVPAAYSAVNHCAVTTFHFPFSVSSSLVLAETSDVRDSDMVGQLGNMAKRTDSNRLCGNSTYQSRRHDPSDKTRQHGWV